GSPGAVYLAGTQGGACRRGAVDAHHLVRRGRTPVPGLVARGRLGTGDAAGRLDDVVVRGPVGVGTARAVAAERAQDQPRIDLAQVLPGDAEPCRCRGANVVDQQVGLADECVEHLSAGV